VHVSNCAPEPWGSSGFGGIWDSPWGDPTTGGLEIPPGSVAWTLEKLANRDAESASEQPDLAAILLQHNALWSCPADPQILTGVWGPKSYGYNGQVAKWDATFNLVLWWPNAWSKLGLGYYEGTITVTTYVTETVHSYKFFGDVDCATTKAHLIGIGRR
jgi:hypothetical protein